MFNQYESNVKAPIAFLKLLNVKVNDVTVNETLKNHPDWPTVLGLSDSFNKWNIVNGAAKTEPKHILPYTVFSAYHQWRATKQCCVLCLAVQALLVLSSINVIANNYLLSFSALSFSFFTKNVFLYLLPIVSWYVNQMLYTLVASQPNL